MPETTTFPETKKRILDNFKNVSDSYAADYAKIAVFLSTKDDFEKALTELSAALWGHYRALARSADDEEALKQTGATRNKFTLAMRAEGSKHGFGMASHDVVDTSRMVLVGAIDGDTYFARVKAGMFFKDMMDLKHGEHTHTLQWLAIARSCKLTNSAVDLYKNILAVEAKKKVVVPGFKIGKGEKQDAIPHVMLWAWLVDCFPMDSAKDGAMPAQESLFTAYYRSPQVVNRYLMDLKDDSHFLSLYLRYRYQKRNWFKPGETGYNAISGGATSKNWGDAKQPNIPGVKKLGNEGYLHVQDRKPYSPDELAKKHFKVVKLHGEQGTLIDPAYN
jgi:hypothetical protein